MITRKTGKLIVDEAQVGEVLVDSTFNAGIETQFGLLGFMFRDVATVWRGRGDGGRADDPR